MTNLKNNVKAAEKVTKSTKMTPAELAALTGLSLPGAAPAKKKAKKVNTQAAENQARSLAAAAAAHAEKVQRELDHFALEMVGTMTNSIRILVQCGDELDLQSDEVVILKGEDTLDLGRDGNKLVGFDVPHVCKADESFHVYDVLDDLSNFFRQLNEVNSTRIIVNMVNGDKMSGSEMITSVYWQGSSKKLENFLLNINSYFRLAMDDMEPEDVAFLPYQLMDGFYRFMKSSVIRGRYAVKTSHGRIFIPVSAIPFVWMDYQRSMMSYFAQFKASVENIIKIAEAKVESDGE